MSLARSKQRNIVMTTRKVRRILDAIRGKNVVQAYQILRLMPYAASNIVLKNVIAASHNARVKHGLAPENLMVSKAFADEGKTMTRYRPRAQGRMYKREKRTSHLIIELDMDTKAIARAKSQQPQQKVDSATEHAHNLIL